MAASSLTGRTAVATILRLLAAIVVVTLLPLDAAGQGNDANKAGVMIDFGNGDQAFIVVPFEEESISSIELLERSGIPMLKVGFGGLGDAVCMIETVGCDISSCRRTLCKDGKPDAAFWQFMQQQENGAWTASPLGASSATVEDGDIDAWLWTGTLPNMRSLTIETLVLQTGFEEGAGPAMFSERELQADESLDRTSLILGGGALAITVAVGAGLILLQRRKRALSSAR
jgi:hypothetical protein